MSKQVEYKDDLIKFEKLYKELAPALVLYARKYVDTVTAEDIVQDTFLKIWNKHTFLLQSNNLKAYLYRSVQHGCLDYLRHQQIEEDYLSAAVTRLKIEEIHHFESDDIYADKQQLEKIYKELEKLPPKCKEIFLMYYIEERKAEEIAQLQQISKRTVETQLYRALKKLRNALLIFFTILAFFP